MVERRCFFTLYFYLGPIFESYPDIILAADRHEIRETVPECALKFGHAIQSFKLIEKGFDCRLPRLFVAYFPSDRFQSCFSFIEAIGQTVVTLLVVSLVEGDVGILINSLMHELGDHQKLIL